MESSEEKKNYCSQNLNKASHEENFQFREASQSYRNRLIRAIEYLKEPDLVNEKQLESAEDSVNDEKERLKKAVAMMTKPTGVKFADLTGINNAKNILPETIVWSVKAPYLFKNSRQWVKEKLFFGVIQPPGNGKTMLVCAAAAETECNLLTVRASNLLSKWGREDAKMHF